LGDERVGDESHSHASSVGAVGQSITTTVLRPRNDSASNAFLIGSGAPSTFPRDRILQTMRATNSPTASTP
jgi:hypothetical protein